MPSPFTQDHVVTPSIAELNAALDGGHTLMWKHFWSDRWTIWDQDDGFNPGDDRFNWKVRDLDDEDHIAQDDLLDDLLRQGHEGPYRHGSPNLVPKSPKLKTTMPLEEKDCVPRVEAIQIGGGDTSKISRILCCHPEALSAVNGEPWLLCKDERMGTGDCGVNVTRFAKR